MKEIAEIRFYGNGWAVRVGVVQLRWTRQTNYRGLALEWLARTYLMSGGLTWREFCLARRQQRMEAQARRNSAWGTKS